MSNLYAVFEKSDFEGGSADTLEDRRRGTRYPTNENALLTYINPATAGRFPVVVCDVSEKGMQLRVSDYVCPGTIVQIRLHRLIVTGEVRYCRRKGNDFRVGLQVTELLSRTGNVEGLL